MIIEAIDQYEYGQEYCLASCYLAIARYFGNDVTMQDLIDEGVVRSSDGYVNHTGGYFNISSYEKYDAAKIKAAIDDGNPVIVAGKIGTNKHYVVAHDYSGVRIFVMDPSGGEFGRLGETDLSSWTKFAICSN